MYVTPLLAVGGQKKSDGKRETSSRLLPTLRPAQGLQIVVSVCLAQNIHTHTHTRQGVKVIARQKRHLKSRIDRQQRRILLPRDFSSLSKRLDSWRKHLPFYVCLWHPLCIHPYCFDLPDLFSTMHRPLLLRQILCLQAMFLGLYEWSWRGPSGLRIIARTTEF